MTRLHCWWIKTRISWRFTDGDRLWFAAFILPVLAIIIIALFY